MSSTDMSGRTVVVTGGNSGIGFETAAGLAGMGARVVITCRNRDKGQAALTRLKERSARGDVEMSVFDLSSMQSVREGAADLLSRLEQIDVLVNNAGLTQSARAITVDGYETTFATNHLGPFLLTMLLLERIKASAPARIVNVSSVAHRTAVRGLDFDDLHAGRRFRGMEVYGRSKLANIYFTMELSRRLEGSGVTVNCLHPGAVRTGFGREGDTRLLGLGMAVAVPFLLTPARGARTSIYLASSPEVDGVTGKYFVRCRAVNTSRVASDEQAARRLWEESERLTGLVPA